MVGGCMRMMAAVALAFVAAWVGVLAVAAATKLAFSMLLILVSLVLPFLLVYLIVTHGLRLFNGERVAHGRGPGHQRHGRWRMSPPPRQKPQPPEEARAWAREAEAAVRDIRRLVRKGDRASRDALSGVPASAKNLVERVKQLAGFHQSLNAHLATLDAANLAGAPPRWKDARRRPRSGSPRVSGGGALVSRADQTYVQLVGKSAWRRDRAHPGRAH